jgi:hypothetical protein
MSGIYQLTNLRNANGISSTGPNLWTHNGVQYATLVRRDWSGWIHSSSDNWVTYNSFNLSTISGNPMGMPVDSTDDHYRLSIMVDPQGYIHVMGNIHQNPLRYVKSVNPEDISAFADARSTIVPIMTASVDETSYQYFLPQTNGDRILFTSPWDTLNQVLGRDTGVFRLPSGQSNWVPALANGTYKIIICDQIASNGDPERAYFRNAYADPNDVIHLAGCWQWVALDENTRRNPFYMKSADGGRHWTTVDGTALTLPLTYADMTGINNILLPNPPDPALTCSQPIPDPVTGYPHMIWAGNGVVYHYYWNGSSWVQETQTNSNICYIRGELYRYGPVSSRVTLRKLATPTQTVKLGDEVSTPVFIPLPDPILLNRGILSVMVPYGDTPAVFSYGNGARLRSNV